MDRLGIVVSPSKAFKATQFTGEFDWSKSQGDKHGGINFDTKEK